MPITPENVIPDMFLPQLAALRNAIFTRILPTFDSIESESKQIETETASRIAANAAELTDGGDIAEAALAAGLDHFEIMSEMRQAVINAFVIAIAHLFEQQRHLLTYNTLLDSEKSSKKREERFRKLFQDNGIDDTLFIHRAKLEELHLAANVAKHGEGSSAENLKSVRPVLFIHPSIFDDPILKSSWVGPVNRPLMGDDLFVQPDDLRAYLDAIESYWRFVLQHFINPRPNIDKAGI